MSKVKTMEPISDEMKQKALKQAISQIQRKCGEGAIMRLGTDRAIDVETISTGSLSLDLALGVGGVPKGRIIEIYGPESSGKTTLALHIIANSQKNRGVAAFIDAEHAFDPIYGRKLGVDLEGLLVSQPDYGEQALEIAETLVSSNAVDVLVVDSVAALVPKAELDGEMGDSHVGLHARLMSQAMRKLTAAVCRSNCCLIFINQVRMKIGVMFGSPETTTGGQALKFYSTIRIEIRRIGSIKSGDQAIGNRTRAKVVKNKVASPFKRAEFDIIYGKGISWLGDVLDIGTDLGIIKKRGSWYAFNDNTLGQGRENTLQYLEDNPDARIDLEGAVLGQLFPEQQAPSEEPAEKKEAGRSKSKKGKK